MTNIEKIQLLKIVKNEIAQKLKIKIPYNKISIDSSNKKLQNKKGCFVTLRKQGKLRGCIGILVGLEPLAIQIKKLALEAAFYDSRFSPVKKDEYELLSIEISILSYPKQIKDLSHFHLGKEGLILEKGLSRSVFLPQVATETKWTKEQFVSTLAKKAGLPSDAWKNSETNFKTFTAEVFTDSLL